MNSVDMLRKYSDVITEQEVAPAAPAQQPQQAQAPASAGVSQAEFEQFKQNSTANFQYLIQRVAKLEQSLRQPAATTPVQGQQP